LIRKGIELSTFIHDGLLGKLKWDRNNVY